MNSSSHCCCHLLTTLVVLTLLALLTNGASEKHREVRAGFGLQSGRDKDRSPAQFRCVLCEAFVTDIAERHESPTSACQKTLNGCPFLLPVAAKALKIYENVKSLTSGDSVVERAHQVCMRLELCEADPPRSQPPTFAGAELPTLPDLRIAMAYGGRDGVSYGTQVRLTIIDNTTTQRSQAFQDFFTYNAPFQYRWTPYTLRTTMVNVTPGTTTTIRIADEYSVNVTVPTSDGSVRGVVIADPCYSSRYMICIFGSLLHVRERLQNLFSALGHYDQVDFYSILGDNFYDRDGTIAPPFFESLSDSIKSKLFVTVPGNHDFWMMGSPWLSQPSTDPNGNGFMQYYGQDVLASVASFPYNFSVNPDKEGIFNHYDRMPSYANFFFYHHVGALGFIGFSGAHPLTDMNEKLAEACLYMQREAVTWVLLIGHWNSAGDGADLDTTTNYLYHATLLSLPGCAELGTKRIKYMLGHTHCNVIDDVDRGFMVGGFGMGGGRQDCGDLGLPYIEASSSQLLVTYFPITHRFDWWDDQYDAVMSCIANGGLSNCRQLGRVWVNVTL